MVRLLTSLLISLVLFTNQRRPGPPRRIAGAAANNRRLSAVAQTKRPATASLSNENDGSGRLSIEEPVSTQSGDVRYAVRALSKAPRFALAVVVTALGIAANAVVYAVVKAVLLNPLPYADPDRLVTLAEGDAHTTNPETVSYATAHDWKRRTMLFEHLSLWSDFRIRVLHEGRADQLRGMRVTADFFDTLGVAMFLGRSFQAEENTPGGRSVLILTYGTWTEQFGGDRTIVGRAIPTVEGSTTVVGVLPSNFHPCTCRIRLNFRGCFRRWGSMAHSRPADPRAGVRCERYRLLRSWPEPRN
jgi:hypothetical protein